MKKFFVKIHLWLSIPLGLIIAVVCLTGAVLVFETEILQLCYPSRYFVKEATGVPLSPADLMSAARRQLPDSVKINGLRIPSDPQRTYQLVLPGKKAAGFIDPYTGKITGIDNGQGFFLKMMRLHRWLLDEYKRDGSFSWGKTVVGAATLVLVLIIVSGVVIWYPRNRKMLRNRLKIKTKGGGYRFWYDLHVSGGFYAALLLLVLALTGLTWSFGWYRTAFYNVFGVTTVQTQTQVPASKAFSGERESGRKGEKSGGERPHNGNSGRQKHASGGEAASLKKESQQTSTDYIPWATVLTDLYGLYPDFNTITLQDGTAAVSTTKYGNTRGSDRYSFDSVTGRITEIQLYKDLPDSDKIRGWIYSVHVGSWGGLATRILSCLVSLAGAVFAITGYYFWIKKKIRRM